MAEAWLQKLRSSQKTCLIQDDGMELAEEYDIRSDELVVRKWRKKGTLGGVGKWEFEVGEQVIPINLDAEGLVESNVNPVFIRKDTKSHFQWRIRNLPYPVSNYKVTAKPEDRQIIISTENKKYYKKFGIPDLDRCGLPIEQGPIDVAHANNTLIISYKKPPIILEMEKKFQQEIKKMKASRDGDMDCTPS